VAVVIHLNPRPLYSPPYQGGVGGGFGRYSNTPPNLPLQRGGLFKPVTEGIFKISLSSLNTGFKDSRVQSFNPEPLTETAFDILPYNVIWLPI